MFLKMFFVLLTVYFTDLNDKSTLSQTQPVRIQLAHNSATEQQAQKQLMDLFSTYPDMVKWVYTEDVIIDDSTRIPHSHPTLTVNTRYLDDDTEQLATFVHEQLHWFEDKRSAERERAILELRELFAEVPVSGGQGARDEYSTYLHLIVCDLEFQALTILLGEEKARELLDDKPYYRWIYEKVLSDKRIREINHDYGFILD